jgi:hypothetical protein
LNTKFNLLTPLRIVCPTNEIMAKATASELTIPIEQVQPDLLYMDSVLVSTGENKNTDVFLPEEMWRAKSSPILKPVNWEHNSGKELIGQVNAEQVSAKSIIEDNQIIGGMYNSFVALKDGTIVSSEMEQAKGFEIPREFDIINQAVIYKYLYPKTAARIVKDAKAGNLFVSMEAWFGNYDYKVGNKIVARNEETAFLDAHLRANGGTGSFGNVNVGRVLRNIVFGGVGIVANPANEDSVIHSFTNASLQQTTKVHSAVASHIIGEIPGATASMESQEVIEIMSENKTDNAPAVASISSEDYKNVVERLVKAEHTIEQRDAAIASAQAETEKLQASVDNLTTAFVEGTKSLTEVLGAEASTKLQDADASSFFTVLAGTIGDKLEASKSLEEQLAEATSKVESLEVEKRSLARSVEIEKLLAEYIEDAQALAARKDKMVQATKNLDDEAFAATLEDTKDLLSVAAKPDFLKKKDEKDEDKKEDKKEARMNKKFASTDDEGITDPAILANVKAEASVSAGNEVVPVDDGNSKWNALAEDLLGVKKS